MADDIDEFLQDYAPEVRQLAQTLRQHVVEVVPDSTETLHPGWKVISYGLQKKFCAIAPHSKWVNLQFHAGAALEDPEHLLDGTGKSMRHVRVTPQSGVPTGVADLLSKAADLAS